MGGKKAADVDAALKLLSVASGLKLQRDAKTGLVSVVGTPGKATSPELASKLQAIIADPTRTARVAVGEPESDADWFGAFPTDEKNPVQRVFIEQILALEKAVPGDGVATLAHEIAENFEGQKLIPQLGARMAMSPSHEVGLGVENKVLDELQTAAGQRLSGARLGDYTLALPAKTGDHRILNVTIHQHEFVVIERVPAGGTKKKMKITRDPGADLGTWQLSGFGASAGLPKGAEATLRQVADIMSKEPAAAVLLQATADTNSASFAEKWLHAVTDGVVNLTKDDPELRSWRRYGNDTTLAGSTNKVQITVRRPTSIPKP
jgi:hypothetical protein